jgi:hypothetical protein
MAKALNIAESTLANWRCKGIGPEFIKMGGAKNASVRYLPVQKVAESSSS